MRTWTVSDVMTTKVVVAVASATYRELVDLIIGRRIGAVPVVDEDLRVVGVVSETDLLRKIEYAGDGEPRLFESRRHRDERGKASGRTAQELMTAPAVVVLRSSSITAAARLMDQEDVTHLPVTDDLGRLVGIVSRGDLLRVHLRPDDEILADLDSGVLAPLSLTSTVSVAVQQGTVTLAGNAERRSTAELAARLSRQIPGVVQVLADIDFDYDDTAFDLTATPIAIA